MKKNRWFPIIVILLLLLIIGGFYYLQKTKVNIPHKNCPHLLKEYSVLINSEQDARNLLDTWINSEYSKEEIGTNIIEKIFKENNSYFFELTNPLPQNDKHIGYRYYKINNNQVFGLACSK